MRYFFQLIALVLIILSVSSCSRDAISKKLIPQKESQFARHYLSRLRSGDFIYVKSLMSPELQSQVDEKLLAKISSYFRPGDPLSVRLIGSQVNIYNGQWQGNFTFEYHFKSGWNIANAALRRTNNGYEVIGLHVYQENASQKEINAFTLYGKSPTHYLVLAAAIIVPLFILLTLIVCAKTPIPRRKWLWVIFILFGVGWIQINWTTGQSMIKIFAIQLFGASAMASSPDAPWIISASIPLGAMLFWLRRKKYISISVNSTE